MQKTRTLTQNKALHLMFTQLADELNGQGLTVMKTLKHDAEIMWTPTLVKELVWRKLQIALTGKESTTEINTQEINKILDTMTKYLGENQGIDVVFPSIESLLNKERMKDER